MKFSSDPQLQLAYNFVQYTGKNIFLTGKAGTGKTTFLHNLRKISLKRMVVVAPTGVAAINAGGVTIHSFFQLPFGPCIPSEFTGSDALQTTPGNSNPNIKKFGREKIAIIRSLDLVVIDEISMVRADMLDAIDEVLRRFRNRSLPFGGVQLLMIGDIQQLAPVAKEEDREILKKYYDSVFFFSSIALKKTDYISIELTTIFRQSDKEFIDMLNKIRTNSMDEETLQKLNNRYDPEFNTERKKGCITLTTHNAQAQEINNLRLRKLSAKAQTFMASIEGDFPEYSFPTERELILKTGAQVMFVKNDSSVEKLYYNGKIGTITGIDENTITVQCDGDDVPIDVNPAEWKNYKYSIHEETKEIKESVMGIFVQYPLKLAWAITIHKSQGLTFDRAVIDAQAAFAHGQVYVALSRCRTLEGLVLKSRITQRCIISNYMVGKFSREMEENLPGETQLNESRNTYFKTLIMDLFDFNPLFYGILHCLKLTNENTASLSPAPSPEIERIKTAFHTDVLTIFNKFNTELQQLFQMPGNMEENTRLHERVQKACVYFEKIIQTILSEPLRNITIETDNREVKKIMNDSLDKLFLNTGMKLYCLHLCSGGFTIKTYLDARAKATLESFERKKKIPVQYKETEEQIKNQSLYNEIKAWRDRKADEMDIPSYRVIRQKTMLEITNRLPATKDELKKIKGIGKRKMTAFGIEIVALVLKYLQTNRPEKPEQKNHSSLPEISVGKNSRQSSFELHKAGKSIQQIALERGMAVSTIENHLACYIGTGEIKIHELVSPEKTDIISDYFLETDSRLLGPAKEILGDDVTWGELRFVLKHLEYMENEK